MKNLWKIHFFTIFFILMSIYFTLQDSKNQISTPNWDCRKNVLIFDYRKIWSYFVYHQCMLSIFLQGGWKIYYNRFCHSTWPLRQGKTGYEFPITSANQRSLLGNWNRLRDLCGCLELFGFWIAEVSYIAKNIFKWLKISFRSMFSASKICGS